ncbi:hypothetical protein ACFFQF_17390 [Haladaptatus pallidirubidus]|uniref:Uncharacterized protein n=1 Tax=Haladaptatus pallidirubidus TaxID=1008152 RepID=A0AAV3URD0_9EURY|nr:hypothetical protein [Haladaptatus pallidirubidus]
MREETREIDGDEASSSEMLEKSETIHNAARYPTPGTLTIYDDQHNDAFED